MFYTATNCATGRCSRLCLASEIFAKNNFAIAQKYQSVNSGFAAQPMIFVLGSFRKLILSCRMRSVGIMLLNSPFGETVLRKSLGGRNVLLHER